MSWREVLEAPSHYSHNPQKSNSGNSGNFGVRGSENDLGLPVSENKARKSNSGPYAHNSHNPQKMPAGPELDRICRRACADFPDVEPERLRKFLEVAEDPKWCTARAARQLAKRMHQGLIAWEAEA